MYVHSMLLEAFVCKRPEGYETRHLNGDGTDNRLDNLAWGTPQENSDDKILHGRVSRGSRVGAAVLSEADNNEINGLLGDGVNCTQIARGYGVCRQTISNIKNNRCWNHIAWPTKQYTYGDM